MMSVKINPADVSHPDFVQLVNKLDADLAIRDGDEHDFYHQFNGIESLDHVVVAYTQEKPIGCGALKAFRNGQMEVKRMYVLPDYRGKGVASQLMSKLEDTAKENHIDSLVLETGINQPEAIQLYQKLGFKRIPNYPPYEGKDMSRCFQKSIKC